MGMRRKALTCAMLTLSVCGAIGAGCGGDDDSGPEAQASAGEWKTWVLPSGATVRVPPPPSSDSARAEADQEGLERAVDGRTADDEELVRRLDAAPVTGPWMAKAMDFVSLRPKDPPYSSRAYAYVAVAMYDAMVSSWYWKERYGRDAPQQDPLVDQPPDPSYPDEHAAMAAAAARVLAYLFPEHPAQRLQREAREEGRSRVIGGVSYPSDVQAGLELGSEVGDRVVAHARQDGIALRWDGSRPPHTPAYWDPPPGSAARPVEPMAGHWKTWVIRSGRQFRPPPPPRYGTPGFKREVEAVISAQENLTPEQKEAALFWAGGQGTPLPAGIWEGVITNYLRDRDLSIPETARAVALSSVAMADAGVASWDAKYTYWYPRPENGIRDSGADPDWKPLIDTPFFPSYTSGHATYSGAIAEVLNYLFPEETEDWNAKAEEAANARVWGGIHWPIDSSVGLRVGRRVGERVVEYGKQDGAEE